MEVSAFHVNAFVGCGAVGNPAAVVPIPAGTVLSDSCLQRIAAQFGLSETAFVQKLGEGDGVATLKLRWLTPTNEVALCGHATLATAHALWSHCSIATKQLSFATLSGELLVDRTADGLMMRFPLNEPESGASLSAAATTAYRQLAEVAVGSMLVPRIAELAFNKRTGKLIVRLGDPSPGAVAAPATAAEAEALCEALTAMPRPDPAALLAVDQSSLAPAERVSGISVTCAGPAAALDSVTCARPAAALDSDACAGPAAALGMAASAAASHQESEPGSATAGGSGSPSLPSSSAGSAASPLRGYGAHFASRYFSPWNGLPEDPVNGSSHTILCPFWADRLRGADGAPLVQLTAVQLSRRPAGGVLQLSLHRSAEGTDSEGWVGIGGAATTLWSGSIKVPL